MKLQQELELEIFRKIANNNHEGFIIVEADNYNYNVLDHNSALVKQLQLSQNKISNLQQIEVQVHPDDKEYFAENFRFNTGQKSLNNFEFRTVNGSVITWVKCRLYSVNVSNNRLLVAFMADITNDVENKYYLLNINERKDTTLHILGHDIRNPIAAIMAANSLLDRSYRKQNYEEMQTFIDIIKDYCNKANDLIQNVLDEEFYQSDSVELNKGRFELTGTINLIYDTFRISQQQPLKKFILQAEYPVYVEADELKLRLVLENLISNAYKFTDEDGTIIITLEEHPGSLVIKVKDDGIGIPEQMQSLIFDKFTKARREGSRGEQPVGLGLHIVKKLVEMHQGKIEFESHEGMGTIFTIMLPQ
jgi:two-component system sensor histidine kinase VicK